MNETARARVAFQLFLVAYDSNFCPYFPQLILEVNDALAVLKLGSMQRMICEAEGWEVEEESSG